MPTPAVLSTPLDPAAARADVWDQTHGAVVSFEGVVRNHDHDRSVTELAYSAHPDADAVMAQVVSEIEDEFGVRAQAWHRVGDLRVGDLALVAACASAHRAEAFAACGELVERIKHRVPVWKRQVFADGSHEWVGLGDC
ncbi:molybdenum cofactor biosynthesis protein MoaE [Luteococcus sanguinis]|uniref:Molybdenum cofactor biosynthesis protein MoaE n=1 Tax=Luteococcus sanguinis TaxID=174038 RepID=A0ABW1X628_9ACTN